MSKPDWTKAPEGATHWDTAASTFCADGIWWSERGEYVGSFNSGWGTSRYIPRPTEPATSNGPEDGLPPVGAVCGVMHMGEWQETKIIGIDDDLPVFKTDWYDGYAYACGHDFKFRPLRTEEDKADDAEPSPETTPAPDFLSRALGHMNDRASTYDNEEGERSMSSTVGAFNAITGRDLTEEEGWLFMIMLKCARTQQGKFKSDNYEDGAAYFGLMGESASRDRG